MDSNPYDDYDPDTSTMWAFLIVAVIIAIIPTAIVGFILEFLSVSESTARDILYPMFGGIVVLTIAIQHYENMSEEYD